MTTSTRTLLTALVLVLAYALLMTGLIGTYEFAILVVLVVGALFLIWRTRSNRSPK
jgi:threonine/homoserine/homoserine lactone efflux protein